MKYILYIIAILVIFSCDTAIEADAVSLPTVDVTFSDLKIENGVTSENISFKVKHKNETVTNAIVVIEITKPNLIQGTLTSVNDTWNLSFKASNDEQGTTPVKLFITYNDQTVTVEFNVQVTEKVIIENDSLYFDTIFNDIILKNSTASENIIFKVLHNDTVTHGTNINVQVGNNSLITPILKDINGSWELSFLASNDIQGVSSVEIIADYNGKTISSSFNVEVTEKDIVNNTDTLHFNKTFSDIELKSDARSDYVDFKVLYNDTLVTDANISIEIGSISGHWGSNIVVPQLISSNGIWNLRFIASDVYHGTTYVKLKVVYKGKTSITSFNITVLEKPVDLLTFSKTLPDLEIKNSMTNSDYKFQILNNAIPVSNASISIVIADPSLVAVSMINIEADWTLTFEAADSKIGSTSVEVIANYNGSSIKQSIAINIVSKDVSVIINETWDLYKSQNYSDAINKFLEIKKTNSNNVSIYSGLSWSYLGVGDEVSALKYFVDGASLNVELNDDFNAGFGIAHNANKNYEVSNQAILKVIELPNQAKKNWVFTHNSDFNDTLLRLTVAQNYYALSDFENCVLMVNKLTKKHDFNPDVNTIEGLQELISELETIQSKL